MGKDMREVSVRLEEALCISIWSKANCCDGHNKTSKKIIKWLLLLPLKAEYKVFQVGSGKAQLILTKGLQIASKLVRVPENR